MDHKRLAELADKNAKTMNAMGNREMATHYEKLAQYHRGEAKKKDESAPVNSLEAVTEAYGRLNVRRTQRMLESMSKKAYKHLGLNESKSNRRIDERVGVLKPISESDLVNGKRLRGNSEGDVARRKAEAPETTGTATKNTADVKGTLNGKQDDAKDESFKSIDERVGQLKPVDEALHEEYVSKYKRTMLSSLLG